MCQSLAEFLIFISREVISDAHEYTIRFMLHYRYHSKIKRHDRDAQAAARVPWRHCYIPFQVPYIDQTRTWRHSAEARIDRASSPQSIHSKYEHDQKYQKLHSIMIKLLCQPFDQSPPLSVPKNSYHKSVEPPLPLSSLPIYI